jgi:thiol-disulfide isomerase/thioredoxin
MFKFSILIFQMILFSFQYLYSQPAKDYFILNGKINGMDKGVIYLGYYDDVLQLGKSDSSFIKNGLFSFSGKLKEPTVAFISLTKREAFGLNSTNIFLEPCKMYIEIKLNKFANAHLTGSGIQNDYEELRLKGNKILKNHPQLFDSNGYLYKNIDDSLSKKLKIVYDSLNRIDYEYFTQHPTSYLTAYLLQYQARNLSPDSLLIFYNRLGENLKHHVVTQTTRSRLKNMKAGSVGTIAPKFFAKDTSGNDFYSGLIKGKYILLDFWASWCMPCRQNSPYLIELYTKYKDKGLRVVGIADDKDLIKWKDAIEKDKTNIWTHVRREANRDLKTKGLSDINDVNEKFNISALPTYILIDKQGVIIGRFQDNLDDLNKLLQKSLE